MLEHQWGVSTSASAEGSLAALSKVSSTDLQENCCLFVVGCPLLVSLYVGPFIPVLATGPLMELSLQDVAYAAARGDGAFSVGVLCPALSAYCVSKLKMDTIRR